MRFHKEGRTNVIFVRFISKVNKCLNLADIVSPSNRIRNCFASIRQPSFWKRRRFGWI